MDFWDLAWVLWVAAFFLIEMPAVFNRREGDTLSEHIWQVFSIKERGKGWKWRRLVLLSALAWLVVHLMTGGWM